MAFKFRSRSSLTNGSKSSSRTGAEPSLKKDQPPTKSSEVSRVTKQNPSKLYPPWLKDSLSLRQLPGIYQGVLGQVQLQHSLATITSQLGKPSARDTDYMNKFTDTDRVHQLLSTSRLPNETLANIWNHVNQTHPGQLTNREVCLAMALVAHFQHHQNYGSQLFEVDATKDPFSIVAKEKKPPVPILYSNYNYSASNGPIKNSKSIPETLNSCDLLVEIGGEEITPNNLKSGTSYLALFLAHPPLVPNSENSKTIASSLLTNIQQSNLLALYDIDSIKFVAKLEKLCQTWIKFLNALNMNFKQSFHILTVKNKRQHSIEALKSRRGQEFAQNLSICYPLAHNVKLRIDELNRIRLTNGQAGTGWFLVEPNYCEQANDLMTSINESWAVLINLFNECNLTRFIELIMDNLNEKKTNLNEAAIVELARELDGCNQVCAICHLTRHLATSSIDWIGMEILSEDLAGEKLISNDMQYYYHARCANIWLNQVDSDKLPFSV